MSSRASPCLCEPGRALGHVPREEDSGRRDALPERRLRRDPAVARSLPRRARAGRRSGVPKPVATITSSASKSRSPGHVVPFVRTTVAVGVALDAVDRRVHDERARAAAHVLLVGLEVAHPERRAREHAEAHRPRRDERDLARPRQQAVRELEAGVALADDHEALAPVRGRLLRLDVVRRVLGAGDPALPRLGHAEREDGRRAAILAVAWW